MGFAISSMPQVTKYDFQSYKTHIKNSITELGAKHQTITIVGLNILRPPVQKVPLYVLPFHYSVTLVYKFPYCHFAFVAASLFFIVSFKPALDQFIPYPGASIEYPDLKWQDYLAVTFVEPLGIKCILICLHTPLPPSLQGLLLGLGSKFTSVTSSCTQCIQSK
jgi:hypothetical protein